jgi:hypothetical protein
MDARVRRGAFKDKEHCFDVSAFDRATRSRAWSLVRDALPRVRRGASGKSPFVDPLPRRTGDRAGLRDGALSDWADNVLWTCRAVVTHPYLTFLILESIRNCSKRVLAKHLIAKENRRFLKMSSTGTRSSAKAMWSSTIRSADESQIWAKLTNTMSPWQWTSGSLRGEF